MATTTLTETATTTATPKKDPHRYRAKSTWHTKPVRNLFTWVVKRSLSPEYTYQLGNEEKLKHGEIPPFIHPLWDIAYVMIGSAIPILLQYWIYTTYPGQNWPWYGAYLFYHLGFTIFSLGVFKLVQGRVEKYGVLDRENRPRDRIADSDVNRVGAGLVLYTLYRTALLCFNWDSGAIPSVSPWIFVKIIAFQLALDFWFYCYHRAMHENDFLWKFHKRHHSTGHPTAGMSILADHVQEIGDSFVIPGLALLVVPLNFWELFMALMATTFVEAGGHSGLRADYPHPFNGLLLRLFDAEIVVEGKYDHLH